MGVTILVKWPVVHVFSFGQLILCPYTLRSKNKSYPGGGGLIGKEIVNLAYLQCFRLRLQFSLSHLFISSFSKSVSFLPLNSFANIELKDG